MATRKAWITRADRAAVLNSGATCADCGADGTGLDPKGRPNPLQVDHVIPEAKGGPSHISNYTARCAWHNRIKSDRLPGERVTWFSPLYFDEVPV